MKEDKFIEITDPAATEIARKYVEAKKKLDAVLKDIKCLEKEKIKEERRNNPEPQNQDIPQYVSVKQLAQYFPAFSELSLRWILFQRKTNGADSFVIKAGKKKIVIDTLKFREWLESNRGGKNGN